MRADEVRDVFESVDAQPSAMFSEALLAQLRADYLRADLDASRDTHHLTLEPILLDVLHDEPGVGHGRRSERPKRLWSRRRIAVAAAAAAVIVAASVVVRTANDDGVEIVPAHPGPASTTVPPSPTILVPPLSSVVPALPDGLQGLPPQGATPSTPETGQLLAGLPIPIWVYEDGRVISARWMSHYFWNGLLEQRLTPEGVELVRAEILALEPLENCHTSGGYYGYADGGRFVCEYPGDPTSLYPDSPQYQRLSELPYGAPSWLPASAWADPEPKPYVPSTYQIQIASADEGAPIDASAMLAALPPEAAALLTIPTQCPAGPDIDLRPNTMCFKVTTEEARQVGTAVGTAPGDAPVYHPFSSYLISLLPYMPHEEPLWCCGG